MKEDIFRYKRGRTMSNAKKTTKPVPGSPEEIQAAVAAAVQKLIAQGKKEGMIRATDLNAILEKMDLNAEKIEDIYDRIDGMNIQIISSTFLLPAPSENTPILSSSVLPFEIIRA